MSIPETAADRIAVMRKVLLHIQDKKPFSELSFEERRVLKECYDAKYFEGIILDEMASGRIVAEYRFDPQLTLAGLQFLDDTTVLSSENDKSNEPNKTDVSGKKDRSGKKFYQSEIFWAVVTLLVTFILWLLDHLLA